MLVSFLGPFFRHRNSATEDGVVEKDLLFLCVLFLNVGLCRDCWAKNMLSNYFQGIRDCDECP